MSEEFDEEAWNQERVGLENQVLQAINELSDFMGCDSFTLPYGQGNWSVKHVTE